MTRCAKPVEKTQRDGTVVTYRDPQAACKDDEIGGWKVRGKITLGENEQFFDKELPLARPAEMREAFKACEEFINKTLPKLLKDAKKKD
jgi:hypothetical protein